MLFQNEWRSVQPRVVFLWRDCEVYSEETKMDFLQGTTLFPVDQWKKILWTLIPERISIDWIFLWNVKFLMIVFFIRRLTIFWKSSNLRDTVPLRRSSVSTVFLQCLFRFELLLILRKLILHSEAFLRHILVSLVFVLGFFLYWNCYWKLGMVRVIDHFTCHVRF